MSSKNKKNIKNKGNRNKENRNKEDINQKDIKSYSKSNNYTTNSVDSDMEECDRLLEQLDEMELNNSSSMSSKVRNLIKEDKEAIRIMNERIKEIESDELDYLDDEITLNNQFYESDNDENEPTKPQLKKSTVLENKESKKDAVLDKDTKDTDEGEDKDTDTNTDTNTEEAEDEMNLDFLANLNREDRIRKQQPKRLHNSDNDLGFFDRVKIFAKDNTRNFLVGTAIALLFIVLVVALVLDSNKNNDDAERDKQEYVTEFLDVDTTPMISTINNYYAALANGETDVVRSLINDSETITDEEIEAKCEEAKAYSELVGNSFLVTDCYVQNGLNDNEYIAYMKFQLQIKNIETPTVGIFTCYFTDESTKDKVDYKISTEVNDKSSDVYKYIIKMSSCENVTDLFAQVDKELEEACEKDSDLKAIVDALENNGETFDTDSEEKSEDKDKETTSPMDVE